MGNLNQENIRAEADRLIRGKVELSLDVVREMSPQEVQLLFYELRLHQIELDMQNDELRRASDAFDTARTHILGLYDQVPVGCCTVSEGGLIVQANAVFARILGLSSNQIIAKSFSTYVMRGDQDKWYFLRKQCIASDETQSCELQMQDAHSGTFAAKLWASVSRINGESIQYHFACAVQVPSDFVGSVGLDVSSA